MALTHEHGATLQRLRSVISAPKAEAYFELSPAAEAAGIPPFVTIARQAFAGGHALAERLAERLTSLGIGRSPWTVWDHELVEKVAAESSIAQDIIEAFENGPQSSLNQFLAGMLVPANDRVDQFTLYRRLSITVRALAQAGQVIIVGRGGAFITRRLPRGVHLWLVADRDWRVRQAAQSLHTTDADAARHVHEIDRGRAAFYRRFWPHLPLSPELFHLTINTELLPEDRAVDSTLPLIRSVTESPHHTTPHATY